MRARRTYMLKLGTGLWGSSTAEHTITYIKQAIHKAKMDRSNVYYAKAMNSARWSVKVIDNENIQVELEGTERQLKRFIDNNVLRCVITIDEAVLVQEVAA